jgi:putative ABC transport system permease protein
VIKIYLKVAFRNLVKNGFHSTLNILGLSIGIGFFLLIAAYVWSELQVNKGLRHSDRQYILQSDWKDPNMGVSLTTLGPLPKALKEDYPNLVANYLRYDAITSNVSKGDKHFREGLQVCDSSFLSMYGFKLLYGDPATAMSAPFSVLITEQKARKFFGRTDVVGETLTIESFSGSKHDFEVTGVIEQPQENSVTHIDAANDNQVYIPEVSLDFFGRDMKPWTNQYIVGYVELKEGVSASALDQPMARLIKENTSPQVSQNLTAYLVPLNKFYLDMNNGLVRKMLYTVSFIALFILLMAIINFVNIAISKSSARIKEVGVRKVMGGLKKQLLVQFMIESLIVVLFATILSLFIYVIARTSLSSILGKEIPSLQSFPTSFIVVPIILVLVIGVTAGIYPAIILSALKAVDSLKGKLGTVKEKIILRKSLVGFQFITAIVVLAGAIIISRQVSLFFSSDLGYNKDFILSAQVPRDWSAQGVRKMETIRNEFARMPELSTVSLSYEIPNGNNVSSLPVYADGKDSTESIAAQALITDENYARAYGIPMKAGRYYEQLSDSSYVVINETAVKALGWKNAEDAIAKRVRLSGTSAAQVIGVTRDFHFGSMKQQIQPAINFHVATWKAFRYLSFKLKPGNISNSIRALQAKWAELIPGAPFDYNFMDDNLKKLYQSELQLKKAAQLSTLLAMIIVILGVIALVSLNVQKRTKEIGIRKVLGASASHIISLFLKEFIPVLIIGSCVAIPVSWFLMRRWLKDYAYRISIGPQPFLISIISLTLLVVFLISIQIGRASSANPVKNLRSE